MPKCAVTKQELDTIKNRTETHNKTNNTLLIYLNLLNTQEKNVGTMRIRKKKNGKEKKTECMIIENIMGNNAEQQFKKVKTDSNNNNKKELKAKLCAVLV